MWWSKEVRLLNTSGGEQWFARRDNTESSHTHSLSSYKPFGAIDGARRLALQELNGILAHHYSSIFQKRHHRWQEKTSVWSGNDGHFSGLGSTCFTRSNVQISNFFSVPDGALPNNKMWYRVRRMRYRRCSPRNYSNAPQSSDKTSQCITFWTGFMSTRATEAWFVPAICISGHG